MTHFVYFDLGNVLLHFDHGRACRQMAEVAGVPTALVWAVVFGELEDEFECGRLDTRQFYERFCQRTESAPDAALLMRAASDIFELNHSVLPLVAQLRAAGYALGVLSNTNPAHWEFVCREKFPAVETLFDEHLLSFRAGAMKPDAAFYRHAIERAGRAAGSIVFFDDRADNVAGALRCGLDAILYESAGEAARQLRARGLSFNY